MKKLLALLLLLACAPAFASIVCSQAQNGTGSNVGSATATFTGAVTAGDTIFVGLLSYSGGSSSFDVSTVTDNTNSGNYIEDQFGELTVDGDRVSIFRYSNSAAAGALKVTATNSAGSYFAMIILDCSGVTTSSALDEKSSGYSASTKTPNSGTTSTLAVANELVIGVLGTPSDASGPTSTDLSTSDGGTIPTNGVVVNPGNSVVWAALDYRVVSATTGVATSMSWSTGNAMETVMLAATYKPAGGGACTHAGYESSGATAVPNGSSGSYWLKNGSFGTPDCSTVDYWQPTAGEFGAN